MGASAGITQQAVRVVKRYFVENEAIIFHLPRRVFVLASVWRSFYSSANTNTTTAM